MAHDYPLVLGIDSSTSACKAIVWDTHGNAAGKGYSALSLMTPRPGWHEQKAESWIEAMKLSIREAVSRVNASRLRALCITHQRESFVAVDERGAPLANGILWMDERAASIMPGLEALFEGDDFQMKTGKRLSVNLTIAKIAWLEKHEPGIFEKAAMYLDVHAYLVHELTGRYATGRGCADPTGLFDMRIDDWAYDLARKIGVRPDQFPEAVETGAVIGKVTRTAAEEYGIPEGLPVVAGIGDGQACGIGANITRPGDAYLSLGTSVVSGMYADHFIVDPAFRTMYGGMPGSYFIETVLLGGAYTVRWFVDKIAGCERSSDAEVIRQFEEKARLVGPGSCGLVFVPYMNGVLGPYWDPLASGLLLGLRGTHGLPHIYRAILEGIAFELRLDTKGVQEALGRSVKRFVAMGSGAESSLWRRIIADVTGIPVQLSGTADAAALGAGIIAAAGAGLYKDAHEAAEKMTRMLPDRFEPDRERHEFYSRIFDEVYEPLFPATRSCADNLARICNPERDSR